MPLLISTPLSAQLSPLPAAGIPESALHASQLPIYTTRIAYPLPCIGKKAESFALPYMCLSVHPPLARWDSYLQPNKGLAKVYVQA